MEKLKFKLIISLILCTLLFFVVQLSIYATNENLEIVKKSDAEYLIYIKGNLSTDFKFAFSNDKNTNPETLTYIKAANDSVDTLSNKIAYVDSSTIALFANDTYMWVKSSNNYILKGIKIDLSDSILVKELNDVDNITKTIKVDLTQVNQTEEVIDDIEYKTTLGKVVLLEEEDCKYQLIKAESSQEYSNFVKLAEKISKLNQTSPYYDKLETYVEFYNLYNKLKNELSDELWTKVENDEILQPKEAEHGEEYVLWLSKSSANDLNLVDVQFLSCRKEISQETVIEKITTKLPVTYDNNVLLIVLGILVLSALFVVLRILMIKKSEKK